MSFESKISSFNEFFFFKEFTCSKTTFRPKPTDEVELADNVISLGENLFIYQIKEREEVKDASRQTETKWFESKVLKLATRQIRDTLTYLQTHQEITIENHRGHAFALRLEKTPTIHKLVVYQPNQLLPQECRTQKHHRSKTAGVIHLLSAEDYRGLIWTLLTPAEFADYLTFREALINRWGNDLANFSEQALMGQYLSGSFDHQPSVDFVKYLAAVEHNAEEWDVSRMVDLFIDRITTTKDPTHYYFVIREIALLRRYELREFKKRIKLSMESAKTNKFVRPFRIAVPRTGCGFVFIPLTQDEIPDRQGILEDMTFVLKYEQRLPKCVGVSCAYEADGWYSEEWCYLEFPWEEHPLMEEKLRTSNPFREAKCAELQRYEFRKDEL